MNNYIDVKNLIPQQPPFVFIDTIFDVSRTSLYSNFTITEKTLLCENGQFREGGLIENIAQTAAAYIGYFNTSEPKIGVIGAIKNFTTYALPAVGETLTTKLTIEQEIFNMILCNAEIRISNKLIATCEMKVAIPEDGV
jgi:predicted hotdog family 3-hydroxylacyl-ACP dehydratase